MVRDYHNEAKDKAAQLVELLTAWIDERKQVDGSSALYNRLLIARECARDTLQYVEELAPPDQQQA